MIRDYIVVGQGLAGSVLAYSLQKQGASVIVIDDGHVSSSSKVAAGLVDPFSGRRFVRVGCFDEAYPMAEGFYRALEKRFLTSFFHPIPACRVFASSEEKSAYEKKKALSTHAPFLGEVWGPRQEFSAPLGGVEVNHTAYLDVPLFLQTLKHHFQETQSYQKAKFQYEALQINPDYVNWHGLSAKKIIFCEGYRGSKNPFFTLPWSLVKGDILTVAHRLPLPKQLLHKGKWILPIQDQLFKVGASYIRDFADDVPTQAGKTEIEAFLTAFFPEGSSLKCVAHQAGIRPILTTNTPVCAWHPVYPHIGIFNGLGSRGVLQAPYYAQKF